MIFKVMAMTFLLSGLSPISPSPLPAEPLAQRTVLSNGLTLIVSERTQLPTIHLQMLFKAGSVLDPPRQSGLAALVAELLPQGSRQRDAVQINREIEAVGGFLSSSAETDYSALSLSILRKDLPLGLSILSDILLNPGFTPGEKERKVSELKARLKRMEEDPRQVARSAFAKKLFGSHPYAYPPEGTQDTLSSISREDILQFFQSFYRPNNACMVLVGQITLDEAVRMVEGTFKGWESGPVPSVATATPPAISRPRIEKIDQPLTQASILWGHLGIARDHPDFYTLQVMNYILGGGGFVSRLVDTIRDNLGLTYGIVSFFDARKYRGAFTIALETKNQNANQALAEIQKELKRFLEKGVSAGELEEAKAYLTGSFPLRMDTNAKLVRLLSAMEFYGLGMDYPEKYSARIHQVTTHEVLRVARTYLHPDKFLLVVVGDQKAIQLKDSW